MVKSRELGKAVVVGHDRLGLLFKRGINHVEDIIAQEREMMERRDAMLRKKHGLPPHLNDHLYLK